MASEPPRSEIQNPGLIEETHESQAHDARPRTTPDPVTKVPRFESRPRDSLQETLRTIAKSGRTDWRVKGAIQKVLGYVPGGGRLHYQLQRRTGGLVNFDRECDIKVDDWRLMMGHLKTAKIEIPTATLLEMGTGWYPTFPFCLYLAGAARVLTFDVNPHLKRDLTQRLIDRLATHVPLIALESGRLEADITQDLVQLAAAFAKGASLETATDNRIVYHAPGDASATTLSDSSVDVVFSNSVLEHVPPPVIDACFTEAMRVLRPGGIVFHSVNCGDHYAYTDRTINQLHYLQFSNEDWQVWNNEFLYQNRLRSIEFTAMAQRAGFAIEIDTSRANPKRLEQLDAITIDPAFSKYSREQLAITSIDFVGRKPHFSRPVVGVPGVRT